MKLVIAEDLGVPVPSWIATQYEVVYDASLGLNPSQLVAQVRDADALVVRNKTNVNRALIDAASRLKVIGRLGVGLDNIDLPWCKSKGVRVVAARGCNAASVAEYVMAVILQRARFLGLCDERVKAGEWNRQSAQGSEIMGKTLGLIGVGDIGQRVAIRARAFGMKVIAVDPFVLSSSISVQDLGIRLCDLQQVLECSDYLSIHVPFNDETHHLIGETELAMMKPHVAIINSSRGGVIDEDALYRALVEVPTRFAALDVREQEPPKPDDPYFRLHNVLLSPHVAGITRESSERVADFILEEVHSALVGEYPKGLVV